MFSQVSDTFACMKADEIVEHWERIVRGLCQKCKTMENLAFEIIKAGVKHYIPSEGRMFLEGRKVDNREDLVTSLQDWCSGRVPGKY